MDRARRPILTVDPVVHAGPPTSRRERRAQEAARVQGRAFELSMLLTIPATLALMVAAFPIIGAIVVSEGWRTAWALIGWCLLPGLALIAWWLARRGPEECGLAWEHNAKPAAAEPAVSMTWAEALWHAGVLGVHPRKFYLQPRGSRRGLVQ